MRHVYGIRLGPRAMATADLVHIDPDVGLWLLTRLYVPARYRRMGYGAAIMEQVLDDADRCGATVALEISPYGRKGVDPGYDRLREWYEGLGFEYTEEHPILPDGCFVRTPNDSRDKQETISPGLWSSG